MSHADPEDSALADPALYFNRELSLLEFNRRVLEQAKNPETPLLERLRFLTISSSNLDEFFEIRVAGLKQQVEFGVGGVGPDALPPQEQLRRIGRVAQELVHDQYHVLQEVLLPALAKEGIRLLRRSEWTTAQRDWVQRFFEFDVLPVLTPLGLDPAHPFPRVLNKGLSFIMELEGKDAFGRNSDMAVMQVPRSLPRVLLLPQEIATEGHDFVMLSSVIHANIGALFPGMKVRGSHQFRVTRNSDLWVDEEETEDLLKTLKGELLARKYGEAVRLEVAENCDEGVAQEIVARVQLGADSVYRVNGPVNLHRLAAIHELVDRPDLKYPSFVPGTRKRLHPDRDIFATLRQGDELLHHPFQSFGPVLELLRQAAQDPAVLAVRLTVYRTVEDSLLVNSLIEAARSGKEVTVVVELRARFDEARNIELATRLQDAGANVVYGVVGYKTHSKMLLVVRREADGLRNYVHLGTGNYHPGTARTYTDFGLLTSRQDIAADVQALFQQLTGLGRATKLNKMLQAPFTLHSTLLKKIKREESAARAGRPARIVAKLNALTEPDVIRSLYRASQAGVEIDLIVRGICRLRPGVVGVSESIRVRSLIGRFLEHTRVFFFEAEGAREVWLSSADWMGRNLSRRIETAFPVEDEKLKARVLREGLELHLEDDTQAWILGSDGSYTRARSQGTGSRNAQLELMAELGASAEVEREANAGEGDPLFFQVRGSQGMLIDPALGEIQSQPGGLGRGDKGGQSRGAARAVEPDGDAQE
ncbi:MAG: polyphosphate kinase [Planctomycetota bacterium]|jgi:polyphosphate kinase